MPSEAPRVGKVSNNATVSWSDGSEFNGYMLVGLSSPELSSQTFPNVRYGNVGEPTETIPVFVKIPIKHGQFNQTVGVFFNEDLSPPNTLYYAWMYTNTDFQVAGPSSSFSVTQDGWTPPSFSLGTPTSGDAPIPNENDNNTVIPPPIPSILTGNVDGNGFDITNLDVLSANTVTADDGIFDDLTINTSITAPTLNVSTLEISGTGARKLVVESTDANGATTQYTNGSQSWTVGLSEAVGPGVTAFTLHDDTFSHFPISVAPSTQAVTFAGAISAPSASINTIGVQTITPGAWFAPSLQNGWANYAVDWTGCEYTIDPLKYVHIRGAIAGGTITGGTLLFTLLPTFRPPKIEMFPIPNGTVYIQPDGQVLIGAFTGGLLVFGNIMFRTT